MNNQQDMDAKIGQAWKAHYDGDDASAVEMFLQLVEEDPNNIDALWGLGLSYRDLDDLENAVQAFQRVKELVTRLLETEAGELGRYFMLNRMVDQQLQQIGDFLG